jgi:hypothetical protein
VRQKAELLKEKVTLIELDNVKERDIALAYQRENATLNQSVRNLRAKVQDLEERIAAGSPGQPAATGPNASPPPNAAASPPAPKPRKKWFQPRRSNVRYSVTILTPESNAPQAQSLEKSLKFLRFQTGETLLIDVDENRLIYYSDEDYKRAAYLGAFLKYKYNIDAPLKLSPNKQHQGRFQVYLKP